MIIYKSLFPHRNKFNGSEAIIYSEIVSRSLLDSGKVFNSDGQFDFCNAKKYIASCENSDGHTFLKLPKFTCNSIMNSTNLSDRNVRYTLKQLRQKCVLFENHVYCPDWLIEDGFLKLVDNTDLKGWQLVFYSLIKERTDYYGGEIDTFAYRLAELFETTKNNIYVLLNILKKKGYIERLSNGHIAIK